MSTVVVNTYTHSVTYVSDNILRVLKDIINMSGLDPSNLANDREIISRGLETWLSTGDLNKVVLEIFNPSTKALIGRWDIDIVYGDAGNSGFWTDTEQIKYHIQKTGLNPSNAIYRIVVENDHGYPQVEGWVSTSFLNTDKFVRHSLGTTITHNDLSGVTSYLRRK